MKLAVADSSERERIEELAKLLAKFDPVVNTRLRREGLSLDMVCSQARSDVCLPLV